MKLTNWKVLSMTALMAVAMAACNTSEAKKEGKEVSAQTQQHQQEEKRVMAKLLLDQGVDVEIIIRTTGLTKEEIMSC